VPQPLNLNVRHHKEIIVNSNPRACIAFIAAGLSGTKGSSVYDYSQSKHINISGSVNPNNINIYDHDRSCHLSGSPNSLYDYGNSAHIQLNLKGSQFTGYDYHTGNHFSGNINGRSVSIYDYQTSSHYNYSV
jgi:hypothetical protein